MIKISETALNVLSEGLQASGMEREQGLRLKEEGDQLTLELDAARKQDRVISYDGRKVLIIDREFEARIGNAFIDVEDTTEGPEIIMRHSE
jgi:Fe-S cluster assembly iron-binding protein IscA